MNDPELIVRLMYLQEMASNANQVSRQNIDFLLSSQDNPRARAFLAHYQSFASMLEMLSSSFECVKKSTTFYFQEAEEEFDYGVATTLQGNYKLGVIGLRNTFELVTLGALFQNVSLIRCGKDTYKIGDHIRGFCDTPSHKCVRKLLFKYPKFSEGGLLSEDKLADRYHRLSAYVHTKGKAVSRQFGAALPVPTFEPARLLDMAAIFVDTVSILGIVLGIQFPSLIQAVQPGDTFAVSRISLMFSPEVIAQLREIRSS